ncbi:hypothetical protein [Streptomyces sp. KLOTTS4A1]|uniref:hypothetical protein n=1 Tax=Streptomyces sp. KLOTTS4A1 TaxID=3390996 RepID=UPI0039F4DCBC
MQEFKEDLGCAGLFSLLAGAPVALAMMDWRPLLVFPAMLVLQPLARVAGPLLRGKRKLGQAAMVLAFSAGLALSAVMIWSGVNLMTDTDPACDPSTSQCNLVIDGRVVGEADASDATSERLGNAWIALSVTVLGVILLCAVLWNGYRAVRRRRT